MKILLWSDVHSHIHRPFAHYEDGMNSRLRDALNVIDQITKAAKKCDRNIFLGDLFHLAPPPAPAFNEVYERIAKLAATCPTFMIAGNHDLRNKYYSGDPRDIPFLKFEKLGVKIIEVTTGASFEIGDKSDSVSVFGFNHRRETDAAELIKDAGAHDILVMHQEVFGADNEFGYTFRGGVHPDDLDKFKWVFTGHIHKPQILNERVVVVGAPLHINFGDVGDRGYFILDTKKDDVEVFDTKFPRFVTLGHGEDAPDDDNFYRPEQAKEKKREALKIPDWEEAVESYCKQHHHVEYVDAGRAIANATPKELIAPQPFSIAHVELANFGVFTEAKYDVDSGLHMVIGDIMGGEGRSNGAGKTTLFEGISWVIYGRTSKGVRGASVMKRNRKRGKACKGSVVLTSPKGELRIERVQKASGSSLEAWLGDHHEEGRVPEVQAWIADTLGVGYEFFQQMVYFSQEQAEFFSEMGDADRKKILGTLLGTRWYESAEQEAKTQRDAAKDLLDTAQADLKHTDLVLEGLIGTRGTADDTVKRWDCEQKERVATAKTSVQCLKVDLSKAKAAVNEGRDEILADKKSELADAEEGHKVAMASLEARGKRNIIEATERLDESATEAEKSLATARKKRGVFGEAVTLEADLEKAEESLKNCRDAREEILERLGSVGGKQLAAGADVKRLEDKISDIENLRTGVRCSTCGAEITEDSKDTCVAEMEEDLVNAKAKLSGHSCAMSDITEERKAKETDIKEAEAQVKSARMTIKGAEKLDTKISTLVTKGENLKANRVMAIGAVEGELKTERVELSRDDSVLRSRIEKRHDEKLAELERTQQADVTRFEERLKQAKVEAKRFKAEKNPHIEARDNVAGDIKKREAEIVALRGDISVEEGRVETFKFWVAGFGREGIRAALLHDFCGVFTVEVNDTLTQMGIEMSAELSPSTELKSKKGEVRDRLDYKITTATGEMEYAELSGGEKVRIDLASMLALNLIASRHFGIEDGLFGILVLDEIFSALDEAGVEVVYQIINGFTARSIYVISHDPSMKSMFDKVLTVLRDGTESVLVA